MAFIVRILIGNFLLLLLHLGYTTKQKNIACEYLLQLLVNGVPSMCSASVQFVTGMWKDQETMN